MVRVLQKGLHTSVQDLGRIGYRKYGVPVSGVMDSHAARLGNSILGNAENDAVLESTLQGPQLQFLTATRIVITGADLSPGLNGASINMNKSISIQKGDIIDFGKRIVGVRSYLAVAGGFQTDVVLKSRSLYDGITENATIDKGDDIPFYSSFGAGVSQFTEPDFQTTSFSISSLEVYTGPEFELLNDEQKEILSTNNFTIGINNRMAYQLQESLKNDLGSIISSAVLPGTVQLTPSGNMIILMRDCQTTGGYPRILQLNEQSINSFAQKMQNETVSFRIS